VSAGAEAVQVVVRPLSPDLLDDYLGFFDRDAFADFPWWSSCYCTFYRDPTHDGDSSPERAGLRRPKAIEIVRSGEQKGYLAYADGKVVGWCNAGPREGYRALRRFEKARDDTPDVGSIVCFVVAAPYRGRGVATALLGAACEGLAAQGMHIAEAYPATTEPPTQPWKVPSDQHEYHGPLKMYLGNGFALWKEMDGWAIVRRAIGEDPMADVREDGW
jgi:GNAT superfamily N-acetyltransferase